MLEVAFEGLQRSTRHKSGLAMRFPRISRIRWDKPPREADELERLEAMLAQIERRASVVREAAATACFARQTPPRTRSTDLSALLPVEQAVFNVDHLSRRSFRHFLAAPTRR